MTTKKPNFFIIGAAKAGTTSLYEYLKPHPQVYFSPVKEPNYFCTDIKVNNFSDTYRKNTFLDVEGYFRKEKLEPLQLTFVREPEHYRRLFEEVSNEKAIGEASTSYLYSTEAAQNIRRYQPRAKIIAILRNPVERAFSHYQMALRYGHTDLDFAEAIKADYNREHKGWGISELFIELGMYYNELKRYYDMFPENQIKVLLFDNLKKNPSATLLDCQQFLEIDVWLPETFETFNKATIPLHKGLNKFVTKWGLKNGLKKYLPGNIQEKLKKEFFSASAQQVIPKEGADFLKDIYSDDIEKTSRLIGMDLTPWLR